MWYNVIKIKGRCKMITYYKLLDMLNRRNMTREQLKNKSGIGSATMTKISKGESVTLKTINEICEVLQCQPGDILEWQPDEKTKNSRLSVLTP